MLATILAQTPDMPLPTPPTPAQFEAYGFAGIIFGSFFFFVCGVLWLGWRFLSGRDKWFMEAQERRDGLLSANLEKLGTTHAAAVERVALSVERVGESSATVQREVSQRLSDLTMKVQEQSHRLSEETIARIVLNAVERIKRE